jgi:hypothetical protein
MILLLMHVFGGSGVLRKRADVNHKDQPTADFRTADISTDKVTHWPDQYQAEFEDLKRALCSIPLLIVAAVRSIDIPKCLSAGLFLVLSN